MLSEPNARYCSMLFNYYFRVFQLQTTLRDERSQWEAEKEAQITAQMESMKEEMVVTGRQLREELQQERSANLAFKRHIEVLQEVNYFWRARIIDLSVSVHSVSVCGA